MGFIRRLHLFNVFPNESASLTARTLTSALNGDLQEVFYVSGHLQIKGTGQLNPAVRQPGFVSANVQAGDYRLELGNLEGEPLYRLRFTTLFVDSDGEERPEVFFSYQLPAIQNTAQIILYHHEEPLSILRISDNPPKVQVSEPNGGEVWRGPAEVVRWEARDDDKDDLFFDVFYSHNNGRNWQPLASHIQETSLVVNSLVLPGGTDARIRVIATDGLHTAEDESDKPFTVLHKPPKPILVAPAENLRPRSNEIITFRGNPNDLENHELAEDNCRWTRDGEVFGIGRTVEALLPQGIHEIRFIAFDDLGQEGEAFMHLEVRPPTIGQLEIVRVDNKVVRIRWLATLGPGLQVSREVEGPYTDAKLPIWEEEGYFVTELEFSDYSLFFRLIITD